MDEIEGYYITTEDGRVLRITEFLNFGFDNRFIALIGNDLYVRSGDGKYRLYTGKERDDDIRP